MNDRVHRALDGELDGEALDAVERRALRALVAASAAVGERLSAVPVPDLVGPTMARIAALDAHAPRLRDTPMRGWWRRALRWFWAPRPVRIALRPAWALVALAAAVALPLAVRETLRTPAGVNGAATGAPVLVQFRLEAPGARHVALAGSFTGWQPRHELHQTTPGVWSVVVPLSPGVHDYTFVVDGRVWVPDPHAPQVPDSFGGKNSRITLLPPREAA